MSKDLTIPISLEEMQPILEHWAKAAHYSRESWLHVEAALPLVREVCPEYYEEVASRMVAAFQSAEAIEGLGDVIVDDLGLNAPADRQLPPASAPSRPL